MRFGEFFYVHASKININVYSQRRAISEVKVKSAYEAKWPIRPALNSCFRSMKRLGILLLPPRWDASPSQGYPTAL